MRSLRGSRALVGALLAVVIALTGAALAREAGAGVTFIVDLTPPTATNLVGTDHTVTATITSFGTPVVGTTVDFQVTAGPNQGDSGSQVTDGNGQATFTYTGDGGVGTDDIEACIGKGSVCDTATKEWVNPTPTPTPSPTPAPTATPTATPSGAAAGALPPTGAAGDGGSGFSWPVMLGLLAGGLLLAAGGLKLLRRRA